MAGEATIRRAFAWWTTLVVGALAACALGAGLGWLLAGWLANGFRFDWYLHGPIPSLTRADFALWVARLSAAVGLLATALALVLLYALPWRLPLARPRPRSRGAHALLLLLAVPLGAGLLLAELYWLGARDGWTRAEYASALVLAGASVGLTAFLLVWMLTWRGLAAGMIARARAGETLVGSIMLHASRRSMPVLLVALLVSAGAGIGATKLTTDVDVVDVLPRGDPNTDAAHNLTERFKSTFTLQVTVMVHVDPSRQVVDEARKLPYRATTPTPDNITDEVYVRAIDEMVGFFKAYVPEGADHAPFVSSIGLTSFYRLINWTYAGGRNAPDESYSLPRADEPIESGRYMSVHEGVWRFVPDAPTALLSPDFRQAAILLMVEPTETMTSAKIGQAALDARDAYVRWAENSTTAYHVFTGDNAPKFTVDVPLANAHQTELAKRDFSLLLPVIGVFIAICLWIAFREPRAIAIAFSSLALSVLWTFGAMGYLGLPLNTVNLTVVPLIMGVGIDYAIHILNEHQHAKASGLSDRDTWHRIGQRSGLALFVASVTSIFGLAVMIVSPSLLIAQLGLLCCVALASMYLVAVTVIPAAATALGQGHRRHEYAPSQLMRSSALAVGRYRALVVGLALLVLVASYASSSTIAREPFGDPPRNWLDDDPMRLEHEDAGKKFYASPEPDAKANVLVFQGDTLDPAAHAYMDAVEAALREQPRVMAHTLRSVPFILRTYLTVRDGIPGAAQSTAFGALPLPEQVPSMVERPNDYPTTRAEIAAVAAEADASPLREFARLFYAWPDTSINVMTFSARAATFEEATEVWDEVWAAIDSVEDQRPEGLTVAFVGNTATNYLFVEKQVPWMEAMAPVVAIVVALLVLVMTRDMKAAAVVAVHNVVTGIVWLGLLQPLGIGLSITLTLPLVFIFALGSDYALHLSLACRADDTARVFETTGKAILFSGITTFGAFAIFSQVSNLAVQRAMIATGAAIVALFVVTTLLVPAFYPPRRAAAQAADLETASASTEQSGDG